ncbi:probable pleckstrin homology domain-containing family N member 1 isoform X2 [Syngnathoides biaculeatus]|uniref:probable pleckstrin homology domain-containing family N member 1 isoform X2 n=1 Tax=Syngnathoides biaculeatus TaxID=300417 RepID=UPI002ADDF38B|nr:probable pleckstrin homology domain-containing family N member 1 isoform X2 [Syngnathoides biaculeatus]
MGSGISCVPQHNFTFSSKSFIRRNSSRLFRKKNPQEGQEKSNSIINILCTVTPRKEMSPKDLQTIENIKWDPPFPYDPASGWKKSSINVKNYGRLIHSSKVRFRFLHCQDIHDCYLDLFQTHLHFVSNNTPGLTYQGTLPLKELTICNLQQNSNYTQPMEYAFQVNGVSLNPIIVYCANQEEMDRWFGLLKENIEANGGSPIALENYTRVKVNQEKTPAGREELRNSINKEPIYEWEGSQRDSLGPIAYVTKVRLQHLPCQQQNDRLLVMYTSTLIILSEEENGLFYKGKLPLNMITVTTPCQDVKPNTFLIEGKLINPIVVSCVDRSEFCDWIQNFKAADVPVLSPPPPVYDIIYTPTQREAPQFDRWSGSGQGHTEPLNFSQSGRGSHSRHFPTHEGNPLSPGYSEPLCYSRPSSTETTCQGSRTSSFSSHSKAEREPRPLPLRYSSPQRSSYLQVGDSSAGMLQLYSTPYSGPHRLEKGLLVKSNSWNTSQTSLGYSLSALQGHSDMCAPRQPLSPLYDEPCSPEIFTLDEGRPVDSWQEPTNLHHHEQSSRVASSSFKLCTPPMGRHSRRSQVLNHSQGHALDLELESPQGQVERRAEAVSRLKLLTAPSKGQEQTHLRSSYRINSSQMFSYSPDLHSYLKPTEPDDQEIDYDNIWDHDRHTGMIQLTSGIPTHRTGLNSGARGLGAMATEQRWS